VTHVVVDTSAWMRRRQPQVGEALAGAIEEDKVALTTPILLELLRSAVGSRDAKALAVEYGFLARIPITRPVEARALEVQERLTERGHHRGPSPVDLLAAAAAESVGAELWHCDRHFELIAEVTGQPVRRVGH